MALTTIKVKLPSGTIQSVKVPDDWDEQQITASMREHFPDEYQTEENKPMELELTKSQPKERIGLLGVGADLARGLGNAVKGGIKFARNTPEMMESLGQDLLEHPGTAQLRGIGQIGAEAADIGKGIINAPYNLNQYLARKHLLPQVLGKLGKLIPHIPEDTGLEKALGLEQKTEGDKLLRGLTEAGSVVAGGVPIAKAIKKVATAPSKERAFQRALEAQIDKAAQETGLAEGDLNKLKDALKLEYSKLHPNDVGELSPVGQQVQINKKLQKLEANPQKNNIPEGELPAIPEKPDTKAMLEEHQKAIDEARDAAEKGLDILSNPSIKAGGKIKRTIQKIKDEASKLYDAARNHYADKQIKVDNSKEIKALGKEVESLSANEGVFEGTQSEREALTNQIKALEQESVNATDIFDLQRTLEKMAENTREKQFASGKGTTDLERKRYGEIADRLDKQAEILAKRLESVGGKDVQKLITEANKGWKTYKQLSVENPVGKAAWRSGNVPSNSLIRLAEEHNANDFMKGLINSDSELRKQLLAAYAGEKNVNKLLKPSSVIDSYIKSLPEVEEKLTAFKNALSDYKAGEKSVAKIDKAHNELVKSMTDAAEAKHLQQQIKFHEDAIPKIEAKMAKVDAKSAEHAKLEKQLKDHKQNLEDKNHLLKKYGKYVVGYLVGKEIANKTGF